MDTQEGTRVLIVEDEVLVGAMLRRLLEETGYIVVGRAADGRRAVEMTQSLRPDVVLMDIELPDMDGLEATRRINESCPTPVVLLTAYDKPELGEHAIAVGVGGYLVKPPDAHEMKRAIAIAIARFGDMMELRRLNSELQAEIAQRKQMEEETKQHNRELAALLDVSRRLSVQRDVDELLDIIARSIVETLPSAEAASLWLYDERQNENENEKEMVVCAWADGGRPRYGGRPRDGGRPRYDDEAIAGQALSPDTSLADLVYRSHQPHITDDTAGESGFGLLSHPAFDSTRSVLGVPLMIEGRLIGALFADNYSRPQAFGDDDSHLLQALAGQVVIAIENAQLFEQVQVGRERLQTLSHRLVAVQEEERRRIAHELHDEVGQLLTGINLALDMSNRLPPDALRASLKEAQDLVSDLMLRVRNLSLDLRPAMLDDLGLLAALRWHFKRYTAQTSMQVNFKHIGLEKRRFAPEVETAAYRIVQEALTNVARHASVHEVTVRLQADQDVLDVQIEDQGAGFDPANALAAETSVGLAGMYERAILLGGHLTVDSAPGAGTCVRAKLPLSGRLERRTKER